MPSAAKQPISRKKRGNSDIMLIQYKRMEQRDIMQRGVCVKIKCGQQTNVCPGWLWVRELVRGNTWSNIWCNLGWLPGGWFLPCGSKQWAGNIGWDSSVSDTDTLVQGGSKGTLCGPIQIPPLLFSNPVPWERLCPFLGNPSAEKSPKLHWGLLYHADRTDKKHSTTKPSSPFLH